MEFEEVENIGQRIKEIRKSKSITIQKLSQFTDLSVGYLSNLERNQASPTLNNLQRICVALGISIRDLLRPSARRSSSYMNMMSTSFKSAVWILERNAVFMSFQPMIQRQKIHRRPGGCIHTRRSESFWKARWRSIWMERFIS